MEIVILPEPKDVAREAASRIATLVRRKPSAVIGLATGSSPQGIYTELARRVGNGELSFATAFAFALDEYVGIPDDHPESYANVIQRDVAVPLGFSPSNVRVPDGRAEDLENAAGEYDAAIRAAGGIDVQILGIGNNGHIGFNEPTSSLASRTRVKTLTHQTRRDNARFFDDPGDVPTRCVTQGIGTILEARSILLVAHGRVKASAIADAVEGPVRSFVPASALQLHPNAAVILDEAAASKLQLTDYYREAEASKTS